MEIEQRIPEFVIVPSQLGKYPCLSTNANLMFCDNCKGTIFYVKIDWGVVAEDHEYEVMYNRSNRTYALREIGLNLYCAKCSDFNENYSKFIYPEDKLVFSDFIFDELDDDERAEIWNCLDQWNQKGSFVSRYKSPLFIRLKEQLIEYEKKHPIKQKIKQKQTSKKKK